MHQLLHKLIWYAALGAVTIYAWRRGGADERLATGSLLVASLIFTLFFRHPTAGWDAVWAIGICTMVTVVYCGIAMRSRSWWPMWAAPFQLISTAVLVVPALDSSLRPLATYVNSEAWDYFTLAAVALGIRFELAPRLAARA